MIDKDVIYFSEEIAKSMDVIFERLKEVIKENAKPYEIDGRICIQRDVTFRWRGEIVKFFAGIVDISPNPFWGEPPCEIQKPLLLAYLKKGQFVFMIKTSLYRGDISKSLTGVAEEIKRLTGYSYLIEGLRIK